MSHKPIDKHTLTVMEFPALRDCLARYVTTDLGREAAHQLTPSTDPAWIRERLDQTASLRALLDSDIRVPLAGIHDLRPWLRQLETRQSLLEPDRLQDIADTLAACTRLRQFLSALDTAAAASLQRWLPGLGDFRALVAAINRCVDADRTIRDEASEKLLQIRRELRDVEARLRQAFEKLATQPELRRALENPNLLIRHGRPVLAVRENHRARVRGMVLDRSHSGATLYIEPDSLAPLSNALEEGRFAERKEIDRILWELTHAVLDRSREIERALAVLAQIDLAHAKACFARALDLHVPTVTTDGPLHLRAARHPLLVALAAEQADRGRVVPVDLRLGDDYRGLLVTGPNTGGKTVLLKTVGLCVLMAQSGLPIAARPDSRIPLYHRIFADIGDEQSLAQSLSTFSAHLRHLVHILKHADAHSLVLLDELGAGTDPDEGAALGTALLESLLDRGAQLLATTHLGRLKTFAYAHTAAENGAMSFDPRSLGPTFRLTVGTPGRSNALAIARRLGMPAPLLAQAEALLAARHQDAAELIDRLQESRRETERRRQRADRLLDDAGQAREQAAQTLQAAREEGHRLARLAEVELADTLHQVRRIAERLQRATANAPSAWRELVDRHVCDIAAVAADTPLAQRQQAFFDGLRRGDDVYAIPFRRRGMVERIRRKRRTVVLLLEGKQVELSQDQISRPDGV